MRLFWEIKLNGGGGGGGVERRYIYLMYIGFSLVLVCVVCIHAK